MKAIPVISADSHISEVEDCFKRIEAKYESRRPKQIFDAKRGAVLEISDLGVKVPMGLLCTAGREPKDFGKSVKWEELHPAGHDPKERKRESRKDSPPALRCLAQNPTRIVQVRSDRPIVFRLLSIEMVRRQALVFNFHGQNRHRNRPAS